YSSVILIVHRPLSMEIDPSPRGLCCDCRTHRAFVSYAYNASCNKRCQEKIFGPNANCNNILSTRKLEAEHAPAFALAGGGGRVARPSDPGDATQPGPAPADSPLAVPASPWGLAASGRVESVSRRDGPALVSPTWQSGARVGRGVG